ncbi:hypothetical protein IEQ34_017111 [Dendrobium chrysotoxum]|uniref:Uncharacterized protein n=1 Tax=Dendrobium chrysotoxum TaxID=161865 RepID=A0AAV7G922_DENCH|nr:hypothetical protein IEQ34_017111 [Dendrobium chrysotoxum]
MLTIPRSLKSPKSRSITAFPNPVPCNAGSTTTSHTTALKTPSPVALAKATGAPSPASPFSSSQTNASVCSSATRSRDASRRGNPTRANTALRASRSRPAEQRRTRIPRAASSASDIERGRGCDVVLLVEVQRINGAAD